MAVSNEVDVTSEEKSAEISAKKDWSCFYQLEGNLLRIYLKLGLNEIGSMNKSNEECLFVLDYSGSMGSDWNQVQNAVRYFVGNSDDNSKDLTHFIIYNHESKESNINEILRMSAGGATSFEAAFDEITLFLNKIDTSNKNNQKVLNIIFMTDGQDNRSQNIQNTLNEFEQYINNTLDSTNIVIHCIGFTANHDRALLEKLCKLSNYASGQYMHGFMPIIHVRTTKAPCMMIGIKWKLGKSTNNEKIEKPFYIESGDQALVEFMPIQRKGKELSLCTFDDCEALGRIACMNSNDLVMVGKVVSVEHHK